MASNDNLLFIRSNHKHDYAQSIDDIWDDSVLIKAYDKAVSLAKDEVAKRLSLETDSSEIKNALSESTMLLQGNNQYSRQQWTVGSPCRAIYSVDGKLYEAIVSKIFKDSGSCIVKFIGYNNIEKVKLSSLQESDGLESQIAQQKDALASKTETVDDDDNYFDFNHEPNNSNDFIDEGMDYESEIPKQKKKNSPNSSLPFNSAFNMMPPAPPLPPQLFARLPESDDDALSSMLMSWYISGFHTGYYHGIKQADGSKNIRKKG